MTLRKRIEALETEAHPTIADRRFVDLPSKERSRRLIAMLAGITVANEHDGGPAKRFNSVPPATRRRIMAIAQRFATPETKP